jgi:hypothetical protein
MGLKFVCYNRRRRLLQGPAATATRIVVGCYKRRRCRLLQTGHLHATRRPARGSGGCYKPSAVMLQGSRRGWRPLLRAAGAVATNRAPSCYKKAGGGATNRALLCYKEAGGGATTGRRQCYKPGAACKGLCCCGWQCGQECCKPDEQSCVRVGERRRNFFDDVVLFSAPER